MSGQSTNDDFSGDAPGASPSSSGGAVGRPYLSVMFACCRVYQRIYRSRDGKEYQGRCPRCGKSVHFSVSPGGTDARFFMVE